MTAVHDDTNVGGAGAAKPIAEGETPFRRFLNDYAESKVAVGGAVGVAIVLLIALFGPWISPTDPYDLASVTFMDNRLHPGGTMGSGVTAMLGTDGLGRDMVSAMIYGLRISLGVGIGSGIIALLIGVSFGLCAAYFGGKVDTVIMRVVDIQLSFPAILIALVLLATLGKGIDKIIVALVLVQWAYYARTVRGSALVERRREYIEAATCLGLSKPRVIFGHMLPNCLPPLIVVATMQVAHAILLEATLSFLGLGLPVTEPSLGLLIANGFEYMMSGEYWISVYPGLALLFTIVTINVVGDRLRDVLNPRLQK
ncbi:MAG: ABC transporter permease [Nisaea sp.]|jgi:peptide/nickel transport system permease protein|uniref:ABC transporter permease n=1 Tax=Nisaea sp. TaxID=2024842 RepID=UPI001B056C2A|nr:ABC transporter permease [Nisaea sp.]MBO6560036.1 ABC transporter permease [Nisaea sp.]